ncbi:hypothetical protein QMK61_16280 [Fulvimonas sp. R45]|uniref:hypothetical protein n=1 Tax=Fulvimonas sp. R45 TaxID=3045937 RepID=UPI0026603276|nr:hypothetical protein [Fulvimonas sp. R45]MDO1530396.1 hypothetical protein [Fulvimonas sp. R45]
MNDTPDPSLELRARARYRDALQRLDPATAGRLRAARRTALATAQAPAHHRMRTLLPIGALAAVALAAMMVWQPAGRDGAPVPAASAISTSPETASSELPPDADGTDPKLYQNLDFYSWLASTHQAQSGSTY